MIQKAGPTARREFLKLVNLVLKTAIFSKKWKVGQIFPIPKMSEWDLSLANTRPIMLLETFRKSLVRVVQKRLSKVMINRNILKGFNFAGLEGESTTVPIHILHNLMEDAKQEKKEMWILLQDIKKAFDSVSITGLRKALNRIKIEGILEDFLIEIYDKREVKVITKEGLSKGIQAQDGIDQGEVISPLMWKIFYDPLLCRIQKSCTGYSLKTSIGNRNLERPKNINIPCLAYADDTTWIAKSLEEMQEIIDKAQEFYELNDIEINPRKSELLVLNSRQSKSQNRVFMGLKKVEVKAKEEKELARFLGVWISAKDQEKSTKNRIKRDIYNFTSLVNNK
jgi:hypothetical protein